MQNEGLIKYKIEQYADMVYKIALTRCKSVELAEDIFQEVFVKYSEKNPRFQNEEHEKAWFIRVTINLTKNEKESAWYKRVERLDENIIFEQKEENEVYSIVSELPKNYRTIIYLFYYEGYKVKEIAKIMRKSEGTIKTWLFRARDILREKLEGGFEDE